jgi:uncharacterized protein YggE
MSEVIVTVRGEHEHRVVPEEGTARITLQVEASDRGSAVEQISQLATPVRDDLAARTADQGLREWNSQRVSVWAERPWNNEGKRLPLVHHASVEFRATFTDFAALSWWLSDVAERDGVQVDGVDWALTPATARTVEAEVAALAVQVAVARATAYASALGLATVSPLEVADVGLLSRDRPESSAAPKMMRAMAFAADASGGGGPAMELQPQDIVVEAAVEARFLAR